MKMRTYICLIGLCLISAIPIKAQYAAPLFMSNINETSGTHTYISEQYIVTSQGPGGPAGPVSFSGTADVVMKAGEYIHLQKGFSAGGFSGGGRTHVQIDGSLTQFVILEPNPITAEVGKYEKLELGINLPLTIKQQIADYFDNTGSLTAINPYDPDMINVQCTFTSPSGVSKTVNGFYFRDMQRNSTGTNWIENNTIYNFRVRFAPNEIGTWTCIASATGLIQPFSTRTITFECVSFSHKGYLEVGQQGRHLRYKETQESFFAMGCNTFGIGSPSLPGEPNVKPKDFDKQFELLNKLGAKGANYVRHVLDGGIGMIEWKKDAGPVILGDYDHKQPQMNELDTYFETARNNSLYVHLCLTNHENWYYQHHLPEFYPPGDNTYLNYNDQWHFFNPYYSGSNGGKTAAILPKDFFSDPACKAYYKKQLRYTLARWGYSPNLAVIDLLSEMDNYEGFKADIFNNFVDDPSYRIDVYNWHNEMTSFIKTQLDNTKLLSSTYSQDNPADLIVGNCAPVVFDLPYIDIISSHKYSDSRDVNVNNRYNISASLQGQYAKPFIFTELDGVDFNCTVGLADNSFHNNLWSTAFMGGYGTGLNWSYDWVLQFGYANNYTTLQSFMTGEDFEAIPYVSQRFPKNPTNGTTGHNALEAITLKNVFSSKAIGWVHNRSIYWAGIDCKHRGKSGAFYDCIGDTANYPLCGSYYPIPNGAQIQIRDVMVSTSYTVNWYSTRVGNIARTETVTSVFDNDVEINSWVLNLAVPATDLDNADWAYKITANNVSRMTNNSTPFTDTVVCEQSSLALDFLYNAYDPQQYSFTINLKNEKDSTVDAAITNQSLFFRKKGSYLLTMSVFDSTQKTVDVLYRQVSVKHCPAKEQKINSVKSNSTPNMVIQTLENSKDKAAIENPKKEKNRIAVYPNPNTGIFYLSQPNGDEAEIIIYSNLGDILLEKKTDRQVELIDLSGFGKGVYYARIQWNDNEVEYKKIIVL